MRTTSAPTVAEPTGALRLTATVAGGRTILSDAYRTAPFHIGLPSRRGSEHGGHGIEVIVQGVGPGIFPDDDLAVDLTAAPGSSLIVRGQGATKLYPAPPDHPGARVRTRLRASGGGRLVYLPGELIPFADSAVRQITTVEVRDGGQVALGEVLTPGRVAMGERDAYRRLEMRLRSSVDGRPVLIERAVLVPGLRPLTSPGRHGGFACAGALYLIGEGWGMPDDDSGIGPVRWGAGRGEGYVLVRLLGPTAQAVRRTMEELLAGVLGGGRTPQR